METTRGDGKLTLELNEKFTKSHDTIPLGEGAILMFTPTISEDYWLFRVKLFEDQAIIAFPKFGTIGIGFAQEEDWNTNLPYTSEAEVILSHIAHNKKYDEIASEDCLIAIQLIQKAVTEAKGLYWG